MRDEGIDFLNVLEGIISGNTPPQKIVERMGWKDEKGVMRIFINGKWEVFDSEIHNK